MPNRPAPRTDLPSRPRGRGDRTDGATGSAARRPTARVAVLVLLVAAAVLVAGCSGAPPFDREAAVSRVVAERGGVVDGDEAGCYVDRVREELGTAPLADGATPQPEQARQLAAIEIDCFGVDKVGATTSTAGAPPTSVDGQIPQPQERGDDPALDALWDRCEAGAGVACDQLFDQAPLGSAYEAFAVTCGGRTQELRCADVYVLAEDPVSTTSTP